MQARVIEVTDHSMYLEIEDQIRFRTDYILKDSDNTITPMDDITFSFKKKNVISPIVVETVVHHHIPGKVQY